MAITVPIPDDVQEAMKKFPEVTWSKVALQGIRDYIKKREESEGE